MDLDFPNDDISNYIPHDNRSPDALASCRYMLGDLSCNLSRYYNLETIEDVIALYDALVTQTGFRQSGPDFANISEEAILNCRDLVYDLASRTGFYPDRWDLSDEDDTEILLAEIRVLL